jgi:hypothetical protein
MAACRRSLESQGTLPFVRQATKTKVLDDSNAS